MDTGLGPIFYADSLRAALERIVFIPDEYSGNDSICRKELDNMLDLARMHLYEREYAKGLEMCWAFLDAFSPWLDKQDVRVRQRITSRYIKEPLFD
jgi:hypothetical protein